MQQFASVGLLSASLLGFLTRGNTQVWSAHVLGWQQVASAAGLVLLPLLLSYTSPPLQVCGVPLPSVLAHVSAVQQTVLSPGLVAAALLVS